MAHWPKTVPGKLVTFSLIAAVASVVMWFGLVLSGPIAWIFLALAAIATLASVGRALWLRRADAAAERDWVGEFSFGDVVKRMRAREASLLANEALELSAR
jgi:hypothetical protein